MTGGLVKEAIIVDCGAGADAAAIAEAAGCVLVQATAASARAAGANAARGDWLLFLSAEAPLDAGWSAAVSAHIDRPGAEDTAAASRLAFAGRPWRTLAARALSLLGPPHPAQGILISRRRYAAQGGAHGRPAWLPVRAVLARPRR